MSCLQVISSGMLTTVQDLGRPSYAHLGVSASGAADSLALRLGNLLVGNPEGAAALEITLTGGTYRFPEGGTFTLTGADFGATLDGAPVPIGRTTLASHGSTLKLGAARMGARGYLCVRGGIRVPLFLASASTHLLSGFGGVGGRGLRTGDLLRIGREPACSPKHSVRSVPTRPRLRFVPGPHPDHSAFAASTYKVSEQVNRMGLRLEGEPLRASGATLSQGVTCGSIQVTNGGQPLILFVEQQTTGGYALLGCIISVDLPSVGQLRPGDRIAFEAVTVHEAVRLLQQRERWIASGEPFE